MQEAMWDDGVCDILGDGDAELEAPCTSATTSQPGSAASCAPPADFSAWPQQGGEMKM